MSRSSTTPRRRGESHTNTKTTRSSPSRLLALRFWRIGVYGFRVEGFRVNFRDWWLVVRLSGLGFGLFFKCNGFARSIGV